MPHPLLTDPSHRLWPLPQRPWVMAQTWEKLLFAHWPLPPEHLRALVPPDLTLDTFDGQAWVSVVPFAMTNVRARNLPRVSGMHAFLELNVRTYVTRDGKPGVWFFSLDASHRLMVEGARTMFSLPYFNAKMSLQTDSSGAVHYTSARHDRRGGEGVLDVTYRPTGDAYHARSGTLDYFLTERYCLYSVSRRGVTYRADIQHAPWQLQPAEAEFAANTVSNAFGIRLPDSAPLLHYSEIRPVLAWYLERA